MLFLFSHLPKIYVIGVLGIAEIGDHSAEIGRHELGVILKIFLQAATVIQFVEEKVQVTVRIEEGNERTVFRSTGRH